MDYTIKAMNYGYSPAITHTHPAYWGARAIFHSEGWDILPDRQGWLAINEHAQSTLGSLLGGGALRQANEAFRKYVKDGTVSSGEGRKVVFYEDTRVRIVGDTNGSYGYVYLTAMLLDGVEDAGPTLQHPREGKRHAVLPVDSGQMSVAIMPRPPREKLFAMMRLCEVWEVPAESTFYADRLSRSRPRMTSPRGEVDRLALYLAGGGNKEADPWVMVVGDPCYFLEGEYGDPASDYGRACHTRGVSFALNGGGTCQVETTMYGDGDHKIEHDFDVRYEVLLAAEGMISDEDDDEDDWYDEDEDADEDEDTEEEE